MPRLQRAVSPLDADATSVAAPARPRLADGSEAWAPSAVHAQHDAVRSAFAETTMVEGSGKYSGLARVGIIVGGSIALWACLIGGVGQLAAGAVR